MIFYNKKKGEKAYRCNLCALTFTRKYNLIAHERIHKGIVEFKLCRFNLYRCEVFGNE